MTDRDGQPLLDDRGKVRFASFLRWRTRELNDRFQAAAIAAIDHHRTDPRQAAVEAQAP